MVFNSLSFLTFFALFLAVHHLPFSWKVKKFNLLIASYLFYAAWNPPFVLLLIGAAIVDYRLSHWLGRAEAPATRRAILILSLTVNLGLLGYFKYGAFLLENFTRLAGLAGVHYRPPEMSIVLPLGISFYTFETISYLIDVYRRRIKPWDSFLDYSLFLTFFPHLVAGPIVRADDFLPQCVEERRPTRRQFGWGLTLIVLGLFEKMVLADVLTAPYADRVFDAVGSATSFDAWIGTLAFSCQIYFDFAGYSTCAIGVAYCLGFVLKENFHFPYAAAGFSDFWSRWHISLSSWLRDYLYIPLGGNRRGPGRTYFNLMLTMLLGGMWHGASWRFLAWGAMHGFYLVVERLIRGDRKPAPGPRPFAAQAPLMLATFVLVCLTWVPFRATSFADALHVIRLMVGAASGPTARQIALWQAAIVLAVTTGVLATHWTLRDVRLEDAFRRLPWWAWSALLAAMTICLLLTSGNDRAFIYFQF